MTLVIPPKGLRCSHEEGCEREAVAYEWDEGEPLCKEDLVSIGAPAFHLCDCGCRAECAGPLDGPAYASQECEDRDEGSAKG